MPYVQQDVFRVALLSMPWALFSRPSVQLSVLKSYVESRDKGLKVHAMHPYLEVARLIGPERYHVLSQDMWLCESFYAAILFPERRESIQRFLSRNCKTGVKKILADFDLIAEILGRHLDEMAARQDWNTFNLIGFSVCFNQLFSSLAAARVIKRFTPDLPILFGGSSCIGEGATALIERFPQVDYVAVGEGEESFLACCRFLRHADAPLPQSVYCRDIVARAIEKDTCCEQLKQLSELPVPDYRDYMSEMRHCFGDQPFIPELPLEFSRGCWWRKCTFCSLNLQWNGYRFKKAEQVYRELTENAARYECLDFFFTDNALPVNESKKLFSMLANDDNSYRFFAEIRAIGDPDLLALFRKGGLAAVQVGVEALSTSLLARMRKGTTAMENIAVMKHCQASGIELKGNLITCFPGSTADEVEETLAALDFVLPYAPLSDAAFFLGQGSPVACNPANYAVSAMSAHPGYKAMLPPEILQGMVLPVLGYRGDRQEQKELWKPVRHKIRTWQNFYRKRKRVGNHIPALSFRDGGSFVIIRQERLIGPVLNHRLRGTSRQIYLFLDKVRSRSDLLARFPGFSEQMLIKFLDDLVAKRLVFRENDQYLALAVRVH